MMVELVRAITADGITLDGAFHAPRNLAANRLPVDLALLVHGTGSNFYAPGILESVAAALLAAETPVLRINTRGHDGLVGRRGGAALEDIDACRSDLAAWVDWALARKLDRIVLIGHSMGGVKSIYAAAAGLAPTAIVAISPPRFCHRMYQEDPRAEAFREDYLRAGTLVEQGRGKDLILVRQPLPLWIQAEGFLDKYGPADRFDLVSHLPTVGCPVLVLVGSHTVENSPAFNNLPDDLAALELPSEQLTIQVIPGADMDYSNDPLEPCRRAADWLDGLQPPADHSRSDRG
ncbi:MAG: hypothetical protein CMJ65_14275 [Planctomycetaceae bacterium]|nr:hypothetical protein [Planctomycetaceae bacterium]